jgi:hypothetical protein
VHTASFCTVPTTVIHHAASSRSVCAIAVAMIEATLVAALMPAASFTKRAPTSLVAAPARAVAVPAIAPRTEEENLAARHERAGYEAK